MMLNATALCCLVATRLLWQHQGWWWESLLRGQLLCCQVPSRLRRCLLKFCKVGVNGAYVPNESLVDTIKMKKWKTQKNRLQQHAPSLQQQMEKVATCLERWFVWARDPFILMFTLLLWFHAWAWFCFIETTCLPNGAWIWWIKADEKNCHEIWCFETCTKDINWWESSKLAQSYRK